MNSPFLSNKSPKIPEKLLFLYWFLFVIFFYSEENEFSAVNVYVISLAIRSNRWVQMKIDYGWMIASKMDRLDSPFHEDHQRSPLKKVIILSPNDTRLCTLFLNRKTLGISKHTVIHNFIHHRPTSRPPVRRRSVLTSGKITLFFERRFLMVCFWNGEYIWFVFEAVIPNNLFSFAPI